ncbi:MAG: metallophosphoesterase [Alphaproteobacteria bacterium]|nr:metallophosphoesterase [Alphaproteobacteria bacterium]
MILGFYLIVFGPIFMHPLRFWLGITFPEVLQFILYLISAAFLTLFLLYLFTDILKLIRLYPKSWKKHERKEGIAFMVISVFITLCGYINAMTPTATEYDIAVSKPHKDFTIAVMSDLHIGGLNMTPAKLSQAVEIVNAANPDLVMFVGDTLDGKSSADVFTKDNYGDILSRFKAKYGVFAVMGNHEYYTNSTEADAELIQNTGIKLLRDESVYIQPLGTYLVGREDRAKNSRGIGEVLPLAKIMPQNSQKDDLIIVFAHNPKVVSDSVAEKADIQISGHTHNGQLFPLNLILREMYEITWGLKKIEDTVLFVSSGLGQWGPPVRTSAVSEIAFIKIKSAE